MKEILLGDLINLNYGKGLPQRDRIEGPFPVYGSGGITDYHNSYYIKGPGIIVGRKGTIGSVYLEKRDFFPIDTVFYVEENKNEYDIKFVYYLLKTLNLDKLNSDAAVPGLNRNTALGQKIKIPDTIELQQKIASILSKYDDLIENNNKRIKILEETAQSIYEEWFVKYKFPGSENIKMIDSGNDDFGMIPEGWEVKKVEEISLIISKGPSLNYVDDKNQGIPVINQKCIRNGEIELNTIQFAEKLKEDKSYCYLEKYDILINSMGTGTLGRVSRNLTIDEKYIIHNCISFVRSNQNKLKQTILYYQIKSKEDYFISLSTGSTGQTTLNIKEIKNVDLIIPDIKIQNNFDNIVIKMFDEIGALKKQNQNLKETRDLLIPRLVSGELDVESLDVK